MTARDRLMSYWGFKFEQYMTSNELGVSEIERVGR